MRTLPVSIRASLRKPEVIAETTTILVDRILRSPDPDDRLRAAVSMNFLLLHHIKLNLTKTPAYAKRLARARR